MLLPEARSLTLSLTCLSAPPSPVQLPTFVFLQRLLGGLQHRLVELLGEFLGGETVPGFGATVGGVKALFGLQGVRGPQAVEQAGALLGD